MKVRCKFCRRHMNRAPQALAENPFCSECIEDRQRVALESKFGSVSACNLAFEEDGGYIFIRSAESNSGATPENTTC